MNKVQIVLILTLVAAIGILWTSISNYYLIALLFGMTLFLFSMSMAIRAQFYVQSISRTKEKGVLLSFDDGPDPVYTPVILDILKKHHAKAMFFRIGKKIKGNEALLRRMQDEGHLLGSHSYSHDPKLGFWTKKKVTEDISQGHGELLRVIPGAGNYYRPPFGVTNPTIALALKKCGLHSVAWSVRSFDTRKKDPDKLLKMLTGKIKGSDIVLLHDTQSITVSILEPLILELQSRNLTLKAELK